jgi:rubrerythrin
MSGNEVFEMAMGMERTGKDFYEALALGCDNSQVRAFCVATARQEAEHLAAFRKMRDQRAKSAPSHPVPPESAEALASLAKGRIQPDPAAVRKVAIGGNLKDALRMAMQMEQDAVSFYGELAARLPDSAKAIQLIVEEEKKHLIGLRSLAV